MISGNPYKKMNEIVKGEHIKLNKIVEERSGAFTKKGKQLLKEDPKIVRIDGIAAKETDSATIFGKKIQLFFYRNIYKQLMHHIYNIW